MKILFITAEGFDTPNPNNQMAEVMIRGFIDAGHNVHLIQSHRKGINPDLPVSLKDSKDLKVDTIVRAVVDKSNFIKRYLDDIKYHFNALKHWRKVKDVDVIYLQSNPTIYIPMILLKIYKKKTPIVYSIYDVFPGHAYDIGVIKNKLLYNIFRWIQKPCYRIADAILVLSDDMKNVVVSEGACKNRVHVVPAWFDINTAREIPFDKNQFVKKYNLSREKFHIQYAGSIGYVFNYKAIIELAYRLKDDNDIQIDIIGDGPMKDRMIKEATERKLNSIVFYPLQPITLVSDVYSACDLCVIPLKKGVIGNGTPSKAPILMACKKVIINAVENWSMYSKMFEEYNMGIAVDVYDYDALATAVRYLKNNPSVINEMANNAYEYGKEHFSSARSLTLILDVLQTVVFNNEEERA